MTKYTAGYLTIGFVSGTPSDRVLASSIAALLCVQLGAGSESQVVFRTIKPHLITVIQDKTAVFAARSSVRIAANDQICFNCKFLITHKPRTYGHQHYSIVGLEEKNSTLPLCFCSVSPSIVIFY